MSVKQVIIIRKDLNMRRGKEIAQGSHASLNVFFNQGKRLKNNNSDGLADEKIEIPLDSKMSEWLSTGYTKITLQVNSEEELLSIYEKAQSSHLNCAIVKDSGRTEFNGVATYTALAIGPNDSEEIDPITSHLKLY